MLEVRGAQGEVVARAEIRESRLEVDKRSSTYMARDVCDRHFDARIAKSKPRHHHTVG